MWPIMHIHNVLIVFLAGMSLTMLCFPSQEILLMVALIFNSNETKNWEEQTGIAWHHISMDDLSTY